MTVSTCFSGISIPSPSKNAPTNDFRTSTCPRLSDDDYVVDMAVVREGQEVVTISENGFGKRSDTSDYRLQ
ncbi:MAG: hypothetical protein IJ936_05700, partial [Peptococcaceae bacterium]|nr:hypothetical protein [Peptococcaceae bacterium]